MWEMINVATDRLALR